MDSLTECLNCKSKIDSYPGLSFCNNCAISKKAEKISADTPKRQRSNVLSACTHCKEAHTACDVSRPCSRCVSLNKLCFDTPQKKRGRRKRQKLSTRASSQCDKVHKKENIQKRVQPLHLPNRERPKSPSFNQPTFDQSPRNLFQSDEPRASISQSFSSEKTNTPPELFIFLSTCFQCVFVPPEIYGLWGYQPNELVDRSLYDFVLGTDASRLLKSLVAHLSPTLAKRIRSDIVQVKKKSGEYEPYEVRTFVEKRSYRNKLDEKVIVAEFRRSKKETKSRVPRFNAAPSTTHDPSQYSLTYSSNVSHPTQKYYLETSSSMLCAEAFAIKKYSDFSLYGCSKGTSTRPASE